MTRIDNKSYLERIQLKTIMLAELEKSSSYDDFSRSAQFCFEQLRDAGFSDVRKISHRADGKNTVFDCTMPQAWSLDHEQRSFLEVCGEILPECGRVLADSTVNPLHANIWSAPTPAGGITAEVVDLDTLNGDYTSARGKWVLYTPHAGVELMGGLYHELAEAEIAGLVCCNMLNAVAMPRDIEWYNGNGLNSWYLTAGEKRFPTFSITPASAGALRRLMAERTVTLHGEMYCRIYDGEIYTVTALIPGESSEEVALLAHLYEPFAGDDAIGFAHLCEFGRQLLERKVRLKKSLRLVFSMELYGFAAYLHEFGKNVILAANFDGLAFLESRDIIVRRLPFFRAGFTDFLNYDLLKKRLPQLKLIPECGNLSDDTFCNDSFFGKNGIPTFWLHHCCDKSHHNTGYLYQPDWEACREQLPVFAELTETLLCAEKLPDYSARAAKEFISAARNILRDQSLSAYEKQIRIQVEYLRNSNRLSSVTSYTGQHSCSARLDAAYDKYSAIAAKLPSAEFSAPEYRAMHLIVSRGKYGYPFSLSLIPENLRRKLHLDRVLWAVFDGTRSLLECIRMADAELNKRTPETEIPALIEDLKLLERYGYVKLDNDREITADDFAAALQKLGVRKNMKMVVHSTFSSLGNVVGGAEACCEQLQLAIGENGVLMMPAFTFQVYLPGTYAEAYDVRNSPSKVGILTEVFRKMPGVYRSFDPCHSFAVWGKNAEKYVAQHHLYPTIDPEHSPLGMLYHEGGMVLTISSASSVTFMHLVEEMCQARCCGKRDEEYRTILPDGQEVKTRAWSWRSFTCGDCPANRTGEIFSLLRKRGQLREVILNGAALKLFAMEDYFHAYRKLMKKYCRNAAVPRKVACSVKSDWDEKKRQLKKTDAYTGRWMPDKD